MTVTHTPIENSAVCVAYNQTHTRLAVFDRSGRLGIWQRDGGSTRWALQSSLATDGLAIKTLCWAPGVFGSVIAGGAADGSVAVWQEAPGEGGWRLAAVLKESTLAVQDVAFAPPDLGPLLAAAYADGYVRLFEASEVLAAANWELQNHFRIGSNGSGISSSAGMGGGSSSGGAATALSWRQPSSPGLPPLLLVGTAQLGAQVWMYRQQLMRWEQAASLGGAQEYGGQPAADVAWAPTLGRPYEIAAVAAGGTVMLWKLTGAADSLQVEQLARLQHSSGVWQVEWNLLGSWLAASTEGGEVCMWRPDLGGEWLLLNRITAEPQAVGA